MKINFKSIINNDNGENVIEFNAPLKFSEENGFKIYEFEEPQNKVMNRIEVSDNIVNIFAGPSTIVLELNETVANEYVTPAGNVMFDAEMTSIKRKENFEEISYNLGQLNNPFGKFKVQLTISE